MQNVLYGLQIRFFCNIIYTVYKKERGIEMKKKNIIVISSIAVAVIIITLVISLFSNSVDKELLKMMENQQTICIEVPIPKDELSYKDIKYEWVELAQLQTYEQFRAVFDDTYGITTFGTNGKNGVVYIDTEGYHTDNSTLLYAFNNQKFVDLYNNTETTEAIRQALQSVYTDITEKSSDKTAKIAYLNAYFNIFPDINTSNFDGSDALTRMEYLAGVYRACQPVSALETYEDLAAYVDPEYENPDTIFALQMADLSYLKIEDGDLNESTYNTGSITRAEAVYTLVQLFYADEYEEVQGKDKAYSDTKNGGNLAKKYKFQDKFCERSYTLFKAMEDEKMPEDLYKAMVVAKNHKLITGDTSRWNEGITKGEALQMLVNVFLDQGADLNLDRGEQSSHDKAEAAWLELEAQQPYFTPNTEHFNVTYNDDNTWKFTYSAEFVGTLYSIADGWYQGASIEDINRIINIAIPMLPENPTGKDVYDTFMELTEVLGRETVITGQGTSPYDYFSSWGDDTTNTDTTQSQQTTNNNQSNTNNSSNKNNSNKNNNSNSSNSSSGGISAEEGGAANGWNVSAGDDAWDNVGDVEIDEDLAEDFLEGLENFNGNN